MKAKIVRATAILYWYSLNRSSLVSLGRHVILESEYVRESEAIIPTARRRDAAALCAFCSPPEAKKARGGLFCMFMLDEHSPREAVQCMSCRSAGVSCDLCHRAEGPSGEGSAARADPSPVRRAQREAMKPQRRKPLFPYDEKEKVQIPFKEL